MTTSNVAAILRPVGHFPTCRGRRDSSRSSGTGPKAGSTSSHRPTTPIRMSIPPRVRPSASPRVPLHRLNVKACGQKPYKLGEEEDRCRGIWSDWPSGAIPGGTNSTCLGPLEAQDRDKEWRECGHNFESLWAVLDLNRDPSVPELAVWVGWSGTC